MQLIIFEDKKAYLDSSPTIDCNHPIINKKLQEALPGGLSIGFQTKRFFEKIIIRSIHQLHY